MLYTFYCLISRFSPLSIRPFHILRLCHVRDFYFHHNVRFVYVLSVTEEVTESHGVKKYDFNETKISKCRAY